MTAFIYHGPLSPDSLMFQGRTDELSRLMKLCQGETQSYAILFGGRQTGKTSLLLRLAARLPKHVRTCRLDYQAISGATTAQVYAFVAQRVARALEMKTLANVDNAPDLIDYICQSMTQVKAGRLVLLMEELGALPYQARQDLANVIRSIFSSRYDSTCNQLSNLMVILAGGVELYNLAASEVSTLHNICEPIYLPDLTEAEAVGLVIDGFSTLGLDRLLAEAIGKSIFTNVNGHPYLTQLVAGVLEQVSLENQLPVPVDINSVIEQILTSDNPLLHHMRKSLSEHKLLDSSKALLQGGVRFSRLDEEMAKLELIGFARDAKGYWQVRNTLFSTVLRRWLANKDDSAKMSLLSDNDYPRGEVKSSEGIDRAALASEQSSQELVVIKDLQDYPNHDSEEAPTDIGIVIALGEEFREIFQQIQESPVYNEDIKQYYYFFEKKYGARHTYRCVATFVGGVGPYKAAIVGDRLMQQYRPATIVNVGIAGSLDSSALVGDVVVGEQVDDYLYYGKVVEGKSKTSFDFQLSGEPYKSDPDYVSHAKNLDFAFQTHSLKWAAQCEERLEHLVGESIRIELIKKGLVKKQPSLLIGNMASGPVVIATDIFVNWLKSHRDRKYLAVEMEAAGIMSAAYTRSTPALVIRGISDYSDERKIELDRIKDGALRRYAMNNALELLWTLMELKLVKHHRQSSANKTT